MAIDETIIAGYFRYAEKRDEEVVDVGARGRNIDDSTGKVDLAEKVNFIIRFD